MKVVKEDLVVAVAEAKQAGVTVYVAQVLLEEHAQIQEIAALREEVLQEALREELGIVVVEAVEGRQDLVLPLQVDQVLVPKVVEATVQRDSLLVEPPVEQTRQVMDLFQGVRVVVEAAPMVRQL